MTFVAVTPADAIYDIITTDDPALGPSTFQGFAPDTVALAREINEGSGDPKITFRGAVAVEGSVVEIGVRGPAEEYLAARNEALRLRYLIGKLGQNYVFGGRTLLAAIPAGGIEYLGRDTQRRYMFAIRFDCWMEAADDGAD